MKLLIVSLLFVLLALKIVRRWAIEVQELREKLTQERLKQYRLFSSSSQ